MVMVVRETPLSLIHLRNMVAVTKAGGVIMPPVPAFYTQPASVDELVTHTVCRVLDLFDLDTQHLQRWGEHLSTRPKPPSAPPSGDPSHEHQATAHREP